MKQFLEVQELQVNVDGTYWDTVIAKESLRSDLVSDGDLELSATQLKHCTTGKWEFELAHTTKR